MRIHVLIGAGLLLAVATPHSTAAVPSPSPLPVVLWRSVLPTVDAAPGWCEGAEQGVRSQAMPLIGADPANSRRLRATWSTHGERLQAVGESRDGGRTWTTAAIDAATSCSGGAAERQQSLNALFDVGAGGRGWFGESWVSSGAAPSASRFRFGGDVHLLADDSGVATAPPAAQENAQNLALAASARDPDEVAAAWTSFDQVPNPFTYLPASTHVRFAESADGGRTWNAPVLVHTAPPGEAVVNTRMVRTAEGAFVVLFDRARLSDLPAALIGTSSSVPLTIHASRSVDGRAFDPVVDLGRGDSSFAARPDAGPSPGLAGTKPDLAAGSDGTVVATWHDGSRPTIRLARSSDDGRTWQRAEDTVRLPGPAYQAAVAVDGRSRTALFWYDFRNDRVGDDAWTITPHVAVRDSEGRWAQAPLDSPFDLAAAEVCEGGPEPLPQQCQPGSHAGPLGVTQDLEALPSGFMAGYTTAGHLATDGLTDAVVARVR